MTYPDFLELCRLEANKATAAWSTDMKATYTHWINRGLKEHWDGAPMWRIWPWLQTTTSETLSSYRFARTEVNGSRCLTLWSEDPRPLWAAGTLNLADALPWSRDGANILVQADGATDTVVAFYASAVPEFDSVTDAASVDDLIPDEAVDWLLAYVFKRNMSQNFSSREQQLLERAEAREERALRDMIDEACSTWQSAPWLDMQLTYQN